MVPVPHEVISDAVIEHIEKGLVVEQLFPEYKFCRIDRPQADSLHHICAYVVYKRGKRLGFPRDAPLRLEVAQLVVGRAGIPLAVFSGFKQEAIEDIRAPIAEDHGGSVCEAFPERPGIFKGEYGRAVVELFLQRDIHGDIRDLCFPDEQYLNRLLSENVCFLLKIFSLYGKIRKKEGSVMFCRFCGASIPDDSMFCEKCGEQLSNESTPQEALPPKKESESGTIPTCRICGAELSSGDSGDVCNNCRLSLNIYDDHDYSSASYEPTKGTGRVGAFLIILIALAVIIIFFSIAFSGPNGKSNSDEPSIEYSSIENGEYLLSSYHAKKESEQQATTDTSTLSQSQSAPNDSSDQFVSSQNGVPEGWIPYSAPLSDIINDMANGLVIYYNGQYYTPEWRGNEVIVYEYDIAQDR